MQISVNKQEWISQRQQIAQTCRASAICSLEKFTSAYLQQIAREFMLLPVNNIHENAVQGVKTDELLATRTRHL